MEQTCVKCYTRKLRNPKWEWKNFHGEWIPICNYCAKKILNNPGNIIELRIIGEEVGKNEYEKHLIKSDIADELFVSGLIREILNKWPLEIQKNILGCLKKDSLLAIELERKIKERGMKMILNVEILRYPRTGKAGRIDGFLLRWDLDKKIINWDLGEEIKNVFDFYENLYLYELFLREAGGEMEPWIGKPKSHDIKWRIWVDGGENATHVLTHSETNKEMNHER